MVATHPERPVSQLSLLSDAERELVVNDWNDTDVPVKETTLRPRKAS